MPSPIMKFFAYEHLPEKLQAVSKPISDLARQMDEQLPDGAEKSAGLRKLLEAKDCLVRTLVPLIVFAVSITLVSEASACHRCGRSAAQCVYAQQTQAYVAPVTATPTVNTYVINSNYPAPLVAGGTSAVVSTGGYQSQVLPLFDPQTYLSSSIELQKAVNGTMSLAFQQGNALAQRSLELQAPAVERLAAGQAASMVLQAAGLEPGKGATAGAQSFVFRRESNGAFHMEPLTTEQVERITLKVEAGTAAATPTPDEISADAKFPLVVKFCAKCHGPDLAAPKGGVYLGDSDNAAKWQRDNFFEIVQQIKKGSMPPASSPQPTQDERAGLLSEFESIINSRLGGAP